MKDSLTPRFIVGVLIPTFNRSGYLKLALKSVLDQPYKNLEIIVIDNGSKDGTTDYLATVDDHRIKYIINDQNLGLIGSINKGVRLFSDKVEWCTILCDDDLLDKNFIGSMIASVVNTTAKTVVNSHRVLIDKNGKKIKSASLAPLVESSLEYICNRSKLKRVTFLTGIFFSRKAFEEIGGYPSFITGMATDDAFIFALSIKDKLFSNKNAIVFIRKHIESEGHAPLGALKHLYALEEYRRYVEEVAMKSNTFTNHELIKLKKALRKYIQYLNSVFWERNVQKILDTKEKDYLPELVELFSIVEKNNFPFTFRVKFDLFCVKKINYCPEASILYRYFWLGWKVLKKVKNLW